MIELQNSLWLVKPIVVLLTIITAIYQIIIPQSWKVMIIGLLKLLTMLMHVNLHSFYCKFFNYSFIDEFESKVNRDPTHIQFIAAETKQVVILQELDELANQVAHWANQEMGFVAKDIIAIVMPNRYELVAIWLGMGKIGCSSALVNINSTGKTLIHALNVSLENNSNNENNKAATDKKDKKGVDEKSKAKQSSDTSPANNKKVVIFDKEVYSKLSPEDIKTLHTEEMQIFVWEDLFASKIKSLPTSRPNKVLRKSVTEKDVLLYIFTSGTTGLPKASKMSHSRLFLASLPFGTLCSINSKSRIYTCLPLYHSAGGVLGVSTAIRYNGCMVLRKKFSARSFAEDCVKFKCNVVQYIGEICRYLVAPPKENKDTKEPSDTNKSSSTTTTAKGGDDTAVAAASTKKEDEKVAKKNNKKEEKATPAKKTDDNRTPTDTTPTASTAPHPAPKPIPPLPYSDKELCIEYAFGNGLTSEIWITFQQRYHIKQIVEFYLSTEGNCGLFNCFNQVGALGYIPRFVDFIYPVLLLKVNEEEKDMPLRQQKGSGGNKKSNTCGVSSSYSIFNLDFLTTVLFGQLNKKYARKSNKKKDDDKKVEEEEEDVESKSVNTTVNKKNNGKGDDKRSKDKTNNKNKQMKGDTNGIKDKTKDQNEDDKEEDKEDVEIDDSTLCTICEPDEIGLVVSEINANRADRRFDGYSDSAASKKKVLKNVLKYGDQYFNTGDLMTRDAAGYFYFSDRSGDTFRWKGENVSTAEVGAVLGGQSFINDVCVYGVPVPHCDGKAGMATIVPTSSSGSDDVAPVWLSELESECQRNLPTYARPIFLRVLHSDAKIPTTATFKHLKNVLIEQGFDPTKINKEDVIYVYDSASSHYTRMTEEMYKKLESGDFRL